MGTMSNHLRNALADFTYRNQAYASPASVWASLYSTEPGVDNSGVELSGAGYGREQVSFGVPVARVCSNNAIVSFGPASSVWTQANWLGLHDASSGGNLLSYSALNPATAVASGDPLNIPIGNINVALLGNLSEYWAHALLNHVLRATAATSPASLFAGLHSTDPTSQGTGTELSGNGYARQGLTFASPVNGQVDNDTVVTFPNSTPGAQGSNNFYGVYDSLTSGNLIAFGPWSTTYSIILNSHFEIPANFLSLEIS